MDWVQAYRHAQWDSTSGWRRDECRGDNITSGSIQLDMTQLKVLDPTGDMGQSLEDHLRGTAPGKEEDFLIRVNIQQQPT